MSKQSKLLNIKASCFTVVIFKFQKIQHFILDDKKRLPRQKQDLTAAASSWQWLNFWKSITWQVLWCFLISPVVFKLKFLILLRDIFNHKRWAVRFLFMITSYNLISLTVTTYVWVLFFSEAKFKKHIVPTVWWRVLS